MPNLNNDIFGMDVKEMTIAEQKQCLQHEIDKLEAIENSDTEVSEVAVVEEDNPFPISIEYKVVDLPCPIVPHSIAEADFTARPGRERIQNFLNEYGKQGWILCSIEQGHAIFMQLTPTEEILK
jgi:hypothetical protein